MNKKSSGQDAGASQADQTEKIEDLQSLKLSVGDTIQLQDVSVDKQRYLVKLIGFMNRKSVLISHPVHNDKLCFIKEGQGFMVRGFAGTKTYEFNSSVISVCLFPYPYLHLVFPSQIKTTNMRSAVRVKFRMVCSIESRLKGDKSSAVIEDMSISGARIHASDAFGKVGDEITVGMRMQVEGENQVFQVSATIRNVRVETDNKIDKLDVIHGVEFTRTESMDLVVLQNLIYKAMLES